MNETEKTSGIKDVEKTYDELLHYLNTRNLDKILELVGSNKELIPFLRAYISDVLYDSKIDQTFLTKLQNFLNN